MKLRNSLLTVAGVLGAAACSYGQFNIFSDSGDESVLTGDAQTSPIPNPLTGAGWGVMSGSNLDGDAIRMWDDGGARADYIFAAASPYTSYFELNLDGYIESGFTGDSQHLLRLGPDGGNWAAFSQSSMEFRFRANGSDGEVMVRTASGSLDSVSVGLDTRFSVSIMANAAASGGSSVGYDKDGFSGTLNPSEYVVIVNGSLVGTYAMFANHTDNLGGFQHLTGTGAAGTVATLQLDNISAVPEPSTYALIAGVLGLGLVIIRRRSR